MKLKYKVALISSITGLLLTACAVTPAAPTPSALPATQVALEIADTNTPSPLPPTGTATTIAPTDTSLPPSKTPAPTDTLTPTLQYTPTPTTIPPTPTIEDWRTPSGEIGLVKGREWFVFADQRTGQIGGFNVDGTGMTWYDLPPLEALLSCVRCRVETYRNFMAYVTIDEFNNSIDLVIAKLPQGELISQISIAPIDYDENNNEYLLMDSLGKMSWSPDGQYLAIAAMPKRHYTDLYLYKRGTSYIEKLSDEDSYVNQISWSDDGQTIYFNSIALPTKEDAGDTIDTFRWTYSINTDVIDFVKSNSYWDSFGGGCAGDGTMYAEITDDENTTKVIINNWWHYDMQDGVFIQKADEEEPRFLFATGNHFNTYKWIETAKRFVIGNEKELVIFNVDGIIDLRMPTYGEDYGWHTLSLSQDRTLAAIITSSGLLKIYQLDDGFHEIWTVPEPVAVDRVYWHPDNTALIVEGLGHVYYVDLIDQEVHLLIYGGADSFSMDYGFWMSQ